MDREKVIKGLEHCFHGQECCGDIECPYYIEHLSDCCCLEECQENLKADAIAMLKEQAKTKVVFGRTKDGEFVTECGNCGTHLDKAYSNCPKCKKELDWNSNQT